MSKSLTPEQIQRIRRDLKYGLNIKRQIRTESTIFSFHAMTHARGAGLALEFVDVIKRFKPLLNYASTTWKLPKLIRTFVTDFFDTRYLGSKSKEEYGEYWNVHIDLDNLHEAEIQCEDENDFHFRGILWVFLHECAHFKTENEDEANSLVEKLIENFSRQKTEHARSAR